MENGSPSLDIWKQRGCFFEQYLWLTVLLSLLQKKANRGEVAQCVKKPD